MLVYRLGAAGPDWDEMDLAGKGAAHSGGRWNQPGVPVVYTSSSIALAVLETVVHLRAGLFPANRYVIEIEVPSAFFARRQKVNPPPPDAWDSIPESLKTKDFGSAWASFAGTLVLDVPSVIVPRERNYLLNPTHPGIKKVKARNLGRFTYDTRLQPSPVAASKTP